MVLSINNSLVSVRRSVQSVSSIQILVTSFFLALLWLWLLIGAPKYPAYLFAHEQFEELFMPKAIYEPHFLNVWFHCSLMICNFSKILLTPIAFAA